MINDELAFFMMMWEMVLGIPIRTTTPILRTMAASVVLMTWVKGLILPHKSHFKQSFK